MIGKLIKKNDSWFVTYKSENDLIVTDRGDIHVYPDDIKHFSEIDNNTEVEFNMIDEFSHPHLYEGVGWGDGITYAKIN